MPTAHVPGKLARDLRLALREQMYFVRLRTMTKNWIHTLFDRYPQEVKKFKPQTDLFGKEGKEQLKTIVLSALDRIVVNREMAFIDELNQFIKASEETIKGLLNKNDEDELARLNEVRHDLTL